MEESIPNLSFWKQVPGLVNILFQQKNVNQLFFYSFCLFYDITLD